MVGRDAGEAHRGVSPLELLVDLCFVVAVAQAAVQLRNDVLSAGCRCAPMSIARAGATRSTRAVRCLPGSS